TGAPEDLRKKVSEMILQKAPLGSKREARAAELVQNKNAVQEMVAIAGALKQHIKETAPVPDVDFKKAESFGRNIERGVQVNLMLDHFSGILSEVKQVAKDTYGASSKRCEQIAGDLSRFEDNLRVQIRLYLDPQTGSDKLKNFETNFKDFWSKNIEVCVNKIKKHASLWEKIQKLFSSDYKTKVEKSLEGDQQKLAAVVSKFKEGLEKIRPAEDPTSSKGMSR
ncbi:MAG: hypothetical protein Q8R79_03920, partial [Legionellaceae bacterium]|nr:hypothetical protein [Legionellaceae bacterium]